MTVEHVEKDQHSWSNSRFVLWILIPLIIGVLLSLLIPRPVIGMIYINDAIYSASAYDVIQQLNVARNSNSIRAVVVVMNSPGGTVSDTESVYREIMALRKTKPVVTVIEGIAASGGYYIACASDYIYAKASSEIGNIGVIGTQPDKPTVFENTFSSGPYKIWGMPRDSFSRELDMLKQGFLQVVKLGRGDRLKMTDETVLRGEVYSGGDALRLGLIDSLGSQSEAVSRAAELAGIRHYSTTNLFTEAGLKERVMEPLGFYRKDSAGNTTEYPAKSGHYMLYIRGLGGEQ